MHYHFLIVGIESNIPKGSHFLNTRISTLLQRYWIQSLDVFWLAPKSKRGEKTSTTVLSSFVKLMSEDRVWLPADSKEDFDVILCDVNLRR